MSEAAGWVASARVIDPAREAATGIAFSIATLVTSPAEHTLMLAAFAEKGFAGDDCEVLVIDNSGPRQTSAYAGLNAALAAARGRHVILCHQDIRPIDDRAALERRLCELDARDPHWAVAGNAGAVGPGVLALRISDPHGSDRTVGDLPARVMSLDENLLIVRRSARIGFSRDLEGFHFYGADICLAADLLGRTAYVIDWHVGHLSAGRKGGTFEASEAQFRAKWSRALRPRWMQTTCALMRLAGGSIEQWSGQLAEPVYRRLAKRLPSARGWAAR